MAEATNITELLRHAAWMQRLARTLARDDAAADDLVQDAWLAALQHPPRPGPTVRAWLAEVLRNGLYARHRSDGRRTRREDAAVDKDARAASAESLVGAMELQKLLADEVLRLDEPYRGTVLACFFEGLTPSELATREGLVAGTVRWRLKQGLEQLRARLDQHHGGARETWLRALGPMLAPAWGRATTTLKGATLMKMALTTLVTLTTATAVTVLITTEQRTAAETARAAATAHSAARATAASADATTANAMNANTANANTVNANITNINVANAKGAAANAATANATASAATAKVDAGTRKALLAKIGALHPAPPLDAAYVQAQMQALVPLIEECHEQAAERARKSGDARGIEGQLFVRVSIVGDPGLGGIVGDSRVVADKSTVADPGLRECVQETMYAAHFPPPRDDGETTIEYPFVFRAPPSSGAGSVDVVLAAYHEQRWRDVITLAEGLGDRGKKLRFQGAGYCGLHDHDAALAVFNALDPEQRPGMEKLCALQGVTLP